MMLTYETLMTWQPGRLESVAESISNRIRKPLLNQQDEIDAGRIPGSWEGTAAERAKVRYGHLHDGINTLAANTSPLVESCEVAASEIRSAQRHAEHSHDAIKKCQINGKHWKITDASSGGVKTESPKLSIGDDDDADVKSQDEIDQVQKQVDGYAHDLASAIAKAEQADHELATSLNKAGSEKYDGGTGSIESATLPPELRGVGAEERRRRMMADPDRYEGYVGTLPKSERVPLGHAVASRAASVLLAHPDDPATAADLANLNSLFGDFGNDPTVAAAIETKMHAWGAVSTLGAVDQLMRDGNGNPSILRALAGHMRDTIGSASQEPGFDGHKFGADLVRATAGGFFDPDNGVARSVGDAGGGDSAALLQFIMGDKDLSGPLLLGAAEQMDDYERHPSSDATGTMKEWERQFGLGPLSPDPLQASHVDPTATILGNLGNHPKGGYHFFVDNSEGRERQDYYFNHRDWRTDGFAGISKLVDGIDGDPILAKDHSGETAALTSRFLHDVHDNPGFDSHGAKAASPYIADILKNNMSSVHDAMYNSPSSGFEPGIDRVRGPNGEIFKVPSVNGMDLNSLMKVATSSDDGMSSVAQGVGGFTQQRADNLVQQLAATHDPEERSALKVQLRGVMQENAAMRGFTQHCVDATAVGDAVAHDQRMAAYSQQVSDAAGTVTGMVPIPGNALAGQLVGFGVGEVTQHLQETFDHDHANTAGGVALRHTIANDDACKALTYETYSMYVKSGLIPHDAVDPALLNRDGSLKSLDDFPASGSGHGLTQTDVMHLINVDGDPNSFGAQGTSQEDIREAFASWNTDITQQLLAQGGAGKE